MRTLISKLLILALLISAAQAQVISRPGSAGLSGWSSINGKIIQDPTSGSDIEFNKSGTGVDFGTSFGSGAIIKTTCSVLSGTGSDSQTLAAFIKQGELVLGITGRVIVGYTCDAPGCTTVDYGYTPAGSEVAAAVAVAAGTTFIGALQNETAWVPLVDTDLIATSEGSATITAGQTRVCLTSMTMAAPTS